MNEEKLTEDQIKVLKFLVQTDDLISCTMEQSTLKEIWYVRQPEGVHLGQDEIRDLALTHRFFRGEVKNNFTERFWLTDEAKTFCGNNP